MLFRLPYFQSTDCLSNEKQDAIPELQHCVDVGNYIIFDNTKCVLLALYM